MLLGVRHLQLVQAVHQEGGLTRAAERLFLTQSALSHRLRDIEGKLGVRLFFRVGKKMVLAPAGERVLAASGPLLEKLEDLEEDIRLMAQGRKGRLRVSTQCYTCYHWLPIVLAELQKEFPQVDVEIVVEATRDPLAALQEGRLDLAIVHSEVAGQDLVGEPLFSDELLVAVHPGHRLAKQPYVRPKDFSQQHLIVHYNYKTSVLAREVLNPLGLKPKKISELQLTEAVLEVVRAGLGIAVLAGWAVEPYASAGAVVAKPLTRKGVRRTWSAAMLRQGGNPPHLRRFLELLKSSRRLKLLRKPDAPVLCAVDG